MAARVFKISRYLLFHNTKFRHQANYAETLKSRIYRYFTKNRTKRYIDVLPDIVQSYNETPHTSLGNISPKDVNKRNEANAWAYQY